jgi:hypothetical protein
VRGRLVDPARSTGFRSLRDRGCLGKAERAVLIVLLSEPLGRRRCGTTYRCLVPFLLLMGRGRKREEDRPAMMGICAFDRMPVLGEVFP